MDTLNLDLSGAGQGETWAPGVSTQTILDRPAEVTIAELMPACAARAAAHRAEVDALLGQIAALQAQVTVLRLELAWYADRDNWRMCVPGADTYQSRAYDDRGYRARKALERE